jgi:dihydroxyacetone kinase
VVVLALVVLVLAALPLAGRMAALQRAALKLQQRQIQAMRLQEDAATLEQSIQALQQRAEIAAGQVAVIKAGHGSDHQPKHAYLGV